jgi:Papain family cysteine protease
MKSLYGRGFVADPPGHRVTKFGAARRSASSSGIDLRQYAPRVMWQRDTETCVGHAVSGAIATAATILAGTRQDPTSPADTYRLACILGNLDAGLGFDAPIVDQGCAPNEAFRAISEWGVRPMVPLSDSVYSDCDSATIAQKPTLDTLMEDSLHIVLGTYDVGIDDVPTALSHGFPVCAAINADALSSWMPKDGTLGAQAGAPDHYIYIVGYNVTPAGLVVFFRNSWSEGWGLDGDGEGDANFLASCTNLRAIKVRP